MSDLFRLKAALQLYDWGKRGHHSLVAQLAQNAIGHPFSVDDKSSYAEVWMGTHANGAAHTFHFPYQPLLKTISSDPTYYLGSSILKKWPSTTHLPYLFKVLSVAKALPLQAHPDKALAKSLNAEDSSEFVDANHKPEIAIAIGEPLTSDGGWGDEVAFTGFAGFRPLEEIQQFIQNIPELARAIGDKQATTQFLEKPSKDTLKAVFGALLSRGVADQAAVSEQIRALVDGIQSGGTTSRKYLDEEMVKVLIKLDGQYPGNVGVLVASFFMNFVKLMRGEAVYIGADEIHAYLEGDIIECMAVSDNVLNAAFTAAAQARDQVPTFLSMLTYTSRPTANWSLPHTPYKYSQNKLTRVYAPPLEEFVVLGTYLSEEQGVEVLGAIGGPTVGIILKGRVKVALDVAGSEPLELERGGVFYAVPHRQVTLQLLDGKGGEVWCAASMV
ncbi:mannose-6-phosphate isomerase [Cristinia sonorae]|uniref:Mannose-6-phosphate isomerase n=1 Tax=Cristinia sonorae TaxID=1940300 RepID=A0A8K0XQ68_9AGAR|nr:mannose-6-phosphate isomerase [Cristinia sonorae]